MFDADHVRLGRIADKLAAARAMPVPPDAFGVAKHGFKLGAPLPEAAVAEFEERHEVAPGPDQMFLPGTLAVAYHGCSLSTQLVVTGPARGRLFNVDAGPLGPYVVEDADFLAWYERWLDEFIGGYHTGWMFGERLPLDEPGLVAVLAGDPSPERRARAGDSLLQLPKISGSAWSALSDAMTTDASASVRVTAWYSLRSRRHQQQRGLDDAGAVADEIAAYARSCTVCDRSNARYPALPPDWLAG